MNLIRSFALLLLIFFIGCNPAPPDTSPPSPSQNNSPENITDSAAVWPTDPLYKMPKGGPLLSTKFKSLDDLKSVAEFEYYRIVPSSDRVLLGNPLVRITHAINGGKITSVMHADIRESDIHKAMYGSLWDKVWLALNSPYFVLNKNEMLRVFTLARRKYHVLGEGDVAFYDLAQTMMYNISDEDLAVTSSEDLSEKGYINTFNHVNAQVFMTTLFSEELADFIADTHERSNMPELISGKFTESQLADLETGPVDNYVDIINNEWGQELGKLLKEKYQVTESTHWTPTLLTGFLNDIQRYYSWCFQIGFKPFKVTDELVTRFAAKINFVMKADAPSLRWPKVKK